MGQPAPWKHQRRKISYRRQPIGSIRSLREMALFASISVRLILPGRCMGDATRLTPQARDDLSGALGLISTGLRLHGPPPLGPVASGVPHATRQGRSEALRGPGLSTGPRMHCLPPGARCIRGTTRHTPGTSIGSPGGPGLSTDNGTLGTYSAAKDALTSIGPDALEKGLTTRLTRSIGSMRGSRPFLHRLCSIVLPDA